MTSMYLCMLVPHVDRTTENYVQRNKLSKCTNPPYSLQGTDGNCSDLFFSLTTSSHWPQKKILTNHIRSPPKVIFLPKPNALTQDIGQLILCKEKQNWKTNCLHIDYSQPDLGNIIWKGSSTLLRSFFIWQYSDRNLNQ